MALPLVSFFGRFSNAPLGFCAFSESTRPDTSWLFAYSCTRTVVPSGQAVTVPSGFVQFSLTLTFTYCAAARVVEADEVLLLDEEPPPPLLPQPLLEVVDVDVAVFWAVRVTFWSLPFSCLTVNVTDGAVA